MHTAPNPGTDRKVLAILEFAESSSDLTLQPFNLLVEFQTSPGIFLDHLADPLDLVTKMRALLPARYDRGGFSSTARVFQQVDTPEPG